MLHILLLDLRPTSHQATTANRHMPVPVGALIEAGARKRAGRGRDFSVNSGISALRNLFILHKFEAIMWTFLRRRLASFLCQAGSYGDWLFDHEK